MEMTAPEAGILYAVYVEEGAKVPVGSPVALILEEGEEPPAEGSVPAAAPGSGTSSPPEKGQSISAVASKPMGSANSTGAERIKVSPLARKIAAEKGIDLRTVKGTGPGGRIVRKDLDAAPAGGARTASTPAAPSVAAIRPTFSSGDQRIPLTGMRTIIAERLLACKTQIPHFYLNIEVDAAPLLTLRKQVNATADEGGPKYTVNDFVLKAIVNAAAAVPAVNASFDGDAIVQFASVNLSVAIAVEDGLVTPVIRDAQTKSLPQISAAVKDLAERARSKKLSPDELPVAPSPSATSVPTGSTTSTPSSTRHRRRSSRLVPPKPSRWSTRPARSSSASACGSGCAATTVSSTARSEPPISPSSKS